MLLFSPAAFAQAPTATVRGVVTDSAATNNLDGAIVALQGTSFRDSTDRSGKFTISNVPAGEYTLSVSHMGFDREVRTINVGGQSLDLTIALRPDPEVVRMDAFNVNTSRAGLDRAASLQRAAANRVDVISSDNLGQLPDSTIADAVRRLPGVNVEKDAQGREGRYVTIRGMNADFNSVSINGQKVVVSNFDGASRSVPMDVVSAASAGTIEVTKSVLPSQDADSIGGSINIKSRSAFDQVGQAAEIEFAVGSQSLASDYQGRYPHDEMPYEASMVWSNTLDEARTMGLALSLDHSNRPYLFRSVESGPYVIDAGDYFPSYGRLEEAFDNVESTGGTARFDWRPTDTIDWSIDIAYSKRETQQGSQRAQVNFDPGFLVGDLQITNGTATRFISEDRSEREVRDYFEAQENLTLSTELVHRLNEWELTYGLGLNQGDFAGDPDRDLRAFFRTGFRDGNGNYLENSYELENGDPYQPLYGDNHATLPASEFALFEVRRGTRVIADETLSGFINAKRDMLWGDRPGYLKFGIKTSDTSRDFDDIRRRYRTADTDWTLDSVVINGNDQVYGSVLADYGIDRAINGQSFGSMIDPIKVREAEAALAAAGVRDEGDANWYLNQNVSRDARADLVNSYDLTERVDAAFVEAQVQTQKLTVIAGARFETTDVTVRTHAGDFFETNPNSPLFVRPITGRNSYDNLLPHLHLRYDENEDLIFRASFNQTLARPSFRQLNPSTDIDPTANDDDGLVLKGRTDLNPVVSSNLDLSVDRYFTGANRVSLGLFYKDMRDNIYRLTRPVIAGDPSNFPANAEVQEFLNADGASVFGVEFSFELGLDVLTDTLSGLSLSGNYTYTDSEVDGIQRFDANRNIVEEFGRTTLFGQVPDTYNLALNFSRGGFDSRLAWNRTGSYLDFGGIDLDANLDDYLAARERLDFSISYRFFDNWTVFAEVSNLLDDDSRAYEGDESTRILYREESGRFTWVGLRWQL